MSEILKNTLSVVVVNLETIEFDIQRLRESVYGVEPRDKFQGVDTPEYDSELGEYLQNDDRDEIKQLDILLEKGYINQQEYEISFLYLMSF